MSVSITMFKEPIIYLSGWGLSGSVWGEATTHSKIYLSLPDLETITLETVMDALVPKVPKHSICVAWSFGGLIATLIAIRHPDRIRQLILLGSTPRFIESAGWPGVSLDEMSQFKQRAAGSSAKLRDYFVKLMNYPNRDRHIVQRIRTATQTLAEDIELWRQYLDLLFNLDIRDQYAELSVPTTHFLGELDAVTKVTAHALQNLNTKVNCITIKGAGHALWATHQNQIKKYL